MLRTTFALLTCALLALSIPAATDHHNAEGEGDAPHGHAHDAEHAHAHDGKPMFIEDFLGVWERTKAYTLDVANRMPADKYGYKPTEEQMTFAAQMLHIAGAAYLFSNRFLGADGEIPSQEELSNSELTKEQILKYIEGAFDYSAAALANLTHEQLHEQIQLFDESMAPRLRTVLLLRDHTTSHRAQAIVYLRLNGVEPPSYVGF